MELGGLCGRGQREAMTWGFGIFENFRYRSVFCFVCSLESLGFRN